MVGVLGDIFYVSEVANLSPQIFKSWKVLHMFVQNVPYRSSKIPI